MKTTILCIGGCLDGQRIHFRGNKFESAGEVVHPYKIRVLHDARSLKDHKIYVYEEIKDLFGKLIEGYKNETK